MGKVFFIADTHFGEDNLIQYENRPFNSVEEMDAEIIRCWNSVVQDTDIVYILGDFGADGYEKQILSKLKGIKYLVKGNHDVKSNSEYRSYGFEEVYDKPIILDEFWILSHEALYVSVNMPYANIFGHVHNSPVFKDYSSHHYCVCVERLNYTPISYNDIKLKIREAITVE